MPQLKIRFEPYNAGSRTCPLCQAEVELPTNENWIQPWHLDFEEFDCPKCKGRLVIRYDEYDIANEDGDYCDTREILHLHDATKEYE